LSTDCAVTDQPTTHPRRPVAGTTTPSLSTTSSPSTASSSDGTASSTPHRTSVRRGVVGRSHASRPRGRAAQRVPGGSAPDRSAAPGSHAVRTGVGHARRPLDPGDVGPAGRRPGRGVRLRRRRESAAAGDRVGRTRSRGVPGVRPAGVRQDRCRVLRSPVRTRSNARDVRGADRWHRSHRRPTVRALLAARPSVRRISATSSVGCWHGSTPIRTSTPTPTRGVVRRRETRGRRRLRRENDPGREHEQCDAAEHDCEQVLVRHTFASDGRSKGESVPLSGPPRWHGGPDG
jgi:hypothetical protein